MDIANHIAAQAENERRARWTALLAEAKNPRLDASRAEPAPELTPWENLLPPVPMPKPEVRELYEFIEKNEVGDAELFQRFHTDKFVRDNSRGMWMAFGGMVWSDDILNTAHAAVMDMATMYVEGGKEIYRYYAEKKADIDVKIFETEKKITMLEVGDDDDGDEKRKLRKELSELKEESSRLGKKGMRGKKLMDERARGLRSKRRSASVLDVSAIAGASLGRTGKEFDQQPTLLAFANGVVDLETGRLLRSSPELYLTKASKYPYPGYHCSSPWWDEHLRKIFCGNEELIDYFETVIGYSATGLQVNKDIWCALGPQADNGKSVTFNAIKEVLGEVCTTIKLDVLLEERFRSKGPDPDLMVLDGIRMGIASEANSQVKFSMERIKAITGGDDVRARAMYADSKIISSRVKLFLHTNDIPSISGYDPGFMLRLRIIPFLARFVRDPNEVNLEKHCYPALGKYDVERELRAAYPAIAAWVVRCARKFMLNMNYATPAVVLENTRAYFEEEDNLGKFIEAACACGPNLSCGSAKLWKAFSKWCVDELGISEKHVISNKRMSAELIKRGYDRVRTRPTTIFGGIEPLPEWAKD